MNTLIPFPENAINKTAQAGALATPLAPGVKQAMRELLVSYVAPGETAEDRVLLLQVWARETSEYPPEIVAQALRKLLRRNPRAPFRPCLHDILAACRRLHDSAMAARPEAIAQREAEQAEWERRRRRLQMESRLIDGMGASAYFRLPAAERDRLVDSMLDEAD